MSTNLQQIYSFADSMDNKPTDTLKTSVFEPACTI